MGIKPSAGALLRGNLRKTGRRLAPEIFYRLPDLVFLLDLF
jgi:hypothetical protein